MREENIDCMKHRKSSPLDGCDVETRVLNIYDAIICVMKEVKNIEKSMTIGIGNNSYKGISDKDVKQKIGEAMAKNNLVCFPIKIEPKTTIERWNEIDPYSKSEPKDLKSKQSIFTEVLVTYKIVYSITGEHIEIQGFGYGVDSQDKGAGKATTYALKNALLYTFLVPTGTIEDTDKTHSETLPIVPVEPIAPKKSLNEDQFSKLMDILIKLDKLEAEKKVEIFRNDNVFFTPAQEVEINELINSKI